MVYKVEVPWNIHYYVVGIEGDFNNKNSASEPFFKKIGGVEVGKVRNINVMQAMEMKM